MKTVKRIVSMVLMIGMFSGTALSATEIHWWHAFKGRMGTLLAEQVDQFNAAQSDYKVIQNRKGNYSETLNAGIAAFRAKKHPHILMVFEVGTATMMAAKGAIKPMYKVMSEAGVKFDPDGFIGPVKGYYTTTTGEMLSMPYNSSTPVLWVNRDAFKKAGLNPDMDLSTWQKVGAALDKLKSSGNKCPLTTAWQSWVHLENLSAYHNVAFATKENGFAGMDTELVFNGPVQIKHIQAMGNWAKEGKFIYAGRRNEGGKAFRAGECALYTESSAGYAGIKKNAEFDFEIRHLPYWEGVKGAPQNTIIGGSSLWVLSGHSTKEYRGVAAFLSFLSSPVIQAAWHQNTGYLPVTLVASQKTKKSGFYDSNPGTDIAGIQMTRKTPTSVSKGLRLGSFDQIRGMIDEELESVWSGKKTAKSALNNAVKRGNVLLRRFESSNR